MRLGGLFQPVDESFHLGADDLLCASEADADDYEWELCRRHRTLPWTELGLRVPSMGAFQRTSRNTRHDRHRFPRVVDLISCMCGAGVKGLNKRFCIRVPDSVRPWVPWLSSAMWRNPLAFAAHRGLLPRLLVPMSAKPSLLELCRMQPRLAESTSVPISPKCLAATPMMSHSTGTLSEPSAMWRNPLAFAASRSHRDTASASA